MLPLIKKKIMQDNAFCVKSGQAKAFDEENKKYNNTAKHIGCSGCNEVTSCNDRRQLLRTCGGESQRAEAGYTEFCLNMSSWNRHVSCICVMCLFCMKWCPCIGIIFGIW